MNRDPETLFPAASFCGSILDPTTPGRRLLQVVGVIADAPAPAMVASALAQAHNARLTIVQTWSPPRILRALGPYPGTVLTRYSRQMLVSQQAKAADARLRALVQELRHPGPVTLRCTRGRVDAVAIDAARSAGPGGLVITDHTAASRWGRFLGRRIRRDTAICKVRIEVTGAPLYVSVVMASIPA